MSQVMDFDTRWYIALFLHMASQFGLRALVFATVAAVAGWKCVLFMLASLAFTAVLTALVDDPSVDSR